MFVHVKPKIQNFVILVILNKWELGFMADMYKRLDALLRERGISGAKLSADLGMSRSFMTELRKGRAKSMKAETAQRIADYLGVSVSYLLGGGEAPDVLDEVDVAFYGEYKELDEEQKQTVRDMVRLMRQRRRKQE